MYRLTPNLTLDRLTVASCFAEVFLAKQGHDGKVGINLLEKIQLPNPASIYGTMLAGVDYVIMGAGIPREIPRLLDAFAKGEEAALRIQVIGATEADDHRISFDPRQVVPLAEVPTLKRPFFLAVVASATLAANLAKKASGHVDGFVVENKTAGGHNAPPRGALRLSEKGEPVYGPKDEPDFQAFRDLGRPFWIAGSFASPEKLREALAAGASGIQVGTLFAFSNDSGFRPDLRSAVIDKTVRPEEIQVFTDPAASPSGFPFKVVNVPGTASEAETYEARPRKCDLGYMRMPYVREDGKIGYRCPSEPIDMYVKKGGDEKDTKGRKCLCNGLLATVGLPQMQAPNFEEPALLTAGDHLNELGRWSQGREYSAKEVIHYLRSKGTA